MNWAAGYQPERNKCWPEVEQFFSHLPPRLFQQGVLLKNNLATFYTDTGQFKDILCREHDPPLLYLHFWLLDDWAGPDNAARAELEQRLFLAMTFAFAAVYTQECILDEGSNFDGHYLLLQQVLTHQSDFHLAQLFPPSSSFWDYHQAFWHEYAEAVLMTDDRRPFGFAQDRPETADPTDSSMTSRPQPAPRNRPPTPDPSLLAGKLAFTKTPMVAVALSLGRENLVSALCGLLDRFNSVFQIMHDIFTIRRDLGQRRFTYPILRTMQEAGLDPLLAVSPEQLLGALVLTGTVEKIGQECLSSLAECRTLANSLNLPTFMTYFEGVERWVDEVKDLFAIKARPDRFLKPVRSGRGPFFVPYVDTLPKVVEMAEGYLLSDLTFRESWEIQRRGVFGRAELTGKAFPMGLIAEILSRQGHDMTASINEVFETLQSTGFRYYDHPHLPPDADDLGLLLRLYPYSPQPQRHRKLLQTPLRWLEETIGPSGEIPVWLMPGVLDNTKSPPVALWGNSCATVEANVLLGLIEYDWDGYRSLIEKSAENWCQRIVAEGLSATHHYIPLYALWTAFELAVKLNHVILNEVKNPPIAKNEGHFAGDQPDPVGNNWTSGLYLAAQTLAERLTLEANWPHLTPQNAAFLILTCLRFNSWSPKLALETPALPINSNWITLLCKTQRYDGSWAGEPLYGTPTRGEFAAWYGSCSVTTAFCYHALKTYLAT